MRTTTHFGFLVCCLVAYSVGPFINLANAAVIYSQVGPSAPTGAFSSNDAGNPTDQKIADNFLFNSPGLATIRSLRFIGGYGLTSPPPSTPPLNVLPPDNFRVVFFAESAGAPGVPLSNGDFHVGAAALRIQSGGPLLNGVYTPLEYVLDLGTGVILSSSTVYWVSIVNNVAPNYGWILARAEDGFDQQVAATLGDISMGSWTIARNGGMYFELSDANVPEPTSCGILLVGTCIAWWFRLRCRSEVVAFPTAKAEI